MKIAAALVSGSLVSIVTVLLDSCQPLEDCSLGFPLPMFFTYNDVASITPTVSGTILNPLLWIITIWFLFGYLERKGILKSKHFAMITLSAFLIAIFGFIALSLGLL